MRKLGREAKQKILVSVVALVFIGSMFGFAMQGELQTQGGEGGESQIKIQYNCTNCTDLILGLDGLSQKYGLTAVEGGESVITLSGPTGTEKLDYLNTTIVEDFICTNLDAMGLKSTECVLRKL